MNQEAGRDCKYEYRNHKQKTLGRFLYEGSHWKDAQGSDSLQGSVHSREKRARAGGRGVRRECAGKIQGFLSGATGDER